MLFNIHLNTNFYIFHVYINYKKYLRQFRDSVNNNVNVIKWCKYQLVDAVPRLLVFDAEPRYSCLENNEPELS